MMKAQRFGSILLGAVLAVALGTPAMAQAYTRSHTSAAAPAAAPPPASALGEAAANAGTVGVISGGVDGTYVRIAADLASVLDDGNRLRVLPVIGKGSVQNVADILYLHGIDIGIVQSDALAYIERHNLYPGVGQMVDYIAKLYEEEVHVLARKDITQLADLAHQKVNVDVRGSGTAMTASVLFDSLGIPVETTNDDQDAALEKLRRGDIAAIVYVVGKPARLFTPLPADSGLHFLAIPLKDALLDTYLPAQLRHADYPALVPDGKPVDTVAVGAVMAVYNWQPNTDRYAKVARFVDAFFSKFHLFLQPPRHPKWKEVNLAAQVPGWTRFPPAQDWLQRNAVASTSGGTMQADFTVFLAGMSGPMASLTDAQKTVLFRQFLQWDSNRHAAR
jgi:TRAP transporter TAXI family solute receptor